MDDHRGQGANGRAQVLIENGRAAPSGRRDSRQPVPVSFAQQDAWLHAQLAGDLPLDTVVVAVRRRGPLDVAALEQALSGMVRRHAAWRTTLPTEEGRPVQVVGEPAAICLPLVDLAGAMDADRRATAMALEDARRPFDLARGPLLRPRLARLAGDEHLLFLTLHRVIADAVSVHRLLLPELAALYAAFAEGAPSPLPAPPIQYADHARWQREWMSTDAAARQLDHWRERLQGAPVFELPVDRARPVGRGFAGARHGCAMGSAVVDALRALGGPAGASLFDAVLAGFLGVLHRYTGDEDVVVGTMAPGRPHREVQRLLGCFANPLALRIDLGGDPSFRTLLERVRAVTREASAHDGVPFERVVDAVRPARDRARHPLFSYAVSLEPFTPPPPGWSLQEVPVDPGTTRFDLEVVLQEGRGGLDGRIVYRTDLFEAATIARLERHYRTFLEAAIADPDRALSRLPLLDERERRQVVVDFNRTARPYPADATIPELFARQVASRPDAVAVEAGDTRLTYAELDRRAGAVARALRSLGVGPGARVAIAMERSPEVIVGCLATLKAGAAYVPLNLNDPPERLRVIVADAGASAVLVRRGDRNALRPPRVPAVEVGEDVGDGVAGDAPDARVSPDDLVYVMYTSGSTGQPKGVATPHRGIARLLFGQDWIHFGPDEVILQAAALSFDVSAMEIWGALLHGGRLVLYPSPVPTVQELAEVIRRHGVTTLWLTPSVFNLVVDEDVGALAGVRQIDIGGEALSVPHVARASRALPSALLINGYGPTECSVAACCYRIPRPVDPGAASIPIGAPLFNTTAYVLDRHLGPVPIGVPGELCLGGPGVARGYLNRPELTAERFVPDPFSAVPGARLYRTGDLVRWRPDGTLDYLGRLDTQVKVRGLRIELGEIEARLARHAAVREAAVVVRDDGPRGKRLIGYVVPRAEARVDVGALREFLRRALPGYMVPAVFVTLPAFPLTASGKLDRRALPPPPDGPVETSAPEPVRDSLESQLVELWQELLGVRPVAVNSDFFDLGGNSLLAAQMLKQVSDITGRAVPFAALYQAPTIAGLSRLLAADEASVPDRAEPAITLNRSGARTPLFLFHGVLNGGAFYALRLARRLGPDQPVHVVHPFDGVRRPIPPTVDAMAEQQLEIVRALQPRGPYRLAGYCNGGFVAYEIARRLHQQGERIELVALIAAAPFTAFARAGRLLRRLAAAVRVSPDAAAEPVARLRSLAHALAALPRRERVPLLARALLRTAGRTTGVEPAMVAQAPTLDFLLSRYYRIVTRYFPAPYPGPVVLLWPEHEPWGPADEAAAAWRPIVSRVDVGIVPGDHIGIVNEHVDVLADHLGARLAGGEGRPPSAGPLVRTPVDGRSDAGPGERRPVTALMILVKLGLGAQSLTEHVPLPLMV
jgi:amino acid adenylation domain-containing protein